MGAQIKVIEMKVGTAGGGCIYFKGDSNKISQSPSCSTWKKG